MNYMLGMHYTSIWWPFFYLVILCVAATVFDRIISRLVGKALKGVAAVIVRLGLMFVLSFGVLWGADALMDGVQLTWWALVALAVIAAALTVLPENDK